MLTPSRAMRAASGIQPTEMNREALAGQERKRLVKRQPDYIAIGAHDLDRESAGQPLDRIAAGLAAPFAGGEIGLDILARKPLEAHPRLHQALPEALVRGHHADRGMDPMVASGQEPQALPGLIQQFG